MSAVLHPVQRKALRFLTAGSVDDGKSTLIGRLLLDSRSILADQLDNLRLRATGAPIDLSLLTDGLEAEREQGITIDVAYRYFATPSRKFIIADAPGHEQYTRNMVTAAAGSDAAVVLVDVTKLTLASGTVVLLPQTRRHTLLAQLLRVPSIVFAVNKLDAISEPEAAFKAVSRALRSFAAEVGLMPAGIVPISALRGDNVAVHAKASWYLGPTLLELLEDLPAAGEAADSPFSMPVQFVAKTAAGTGAQRRVLWGRIAQGAILIGDSVQTFPSGERATVIGLKQAGRGTRASVAGQSVGVVLDRHLDISRGDWLSQPGALQPVQRFTATLAWLDTQGASIGGKYLVRHGNQWAQARLALISHRIDVQTLHQVPAGVLDVNDIGEVVIELQQPLPLASYSVNRVGGALIVVDPATHRTSGALLVRSALEVSCPSPLN